jgi:predicted methyltransferase
MKYRMLAISLIQGLVIVSMGMTAQAGDITEKLEMALKSDIRSEADTKRDKNRKPKETLAFFGLEDDMKVVELMPGGGWYTKLLAPILSEKGELHVAYGTGNVEKGLLKEPGFDKVMVTAKKSKFVRPEGAARYTLENTDLKIRNQDIVFTFRNYHNFSKATRLEMNQAAHKALKKGGIYALVDHTRRHMQVDNSENGRRVDPVMAIKEIQDSGFELVDYSDLHYRADDELQYEVGRRSVSGNTDRWTLKFKKI